jgi:cell division protein ZapE
MVRHHTEAPVVKARDNASHNINHHPFRNSDSLKLWYIKGMSVVEKYYQETQRKLFEHDSAQLEVIDQLQALYDHLHDHRNSHQQTHHQNGVGLYLWGDIGRGKTWLMDLFYGSLEFDNKLRLHFRHFMQNIHDELAHISGHKDPLPIIAKQYSQRTRIICLDEFFVEDISDAVILYRLLEALFAQGITMVFTSNLIPEELYKNGLQRDRFLPAIELIQNNTTVFHIHGDTDHRLRKLTHADTYFTPIDDTSELAMEQRFTGLAPSLGMADMQLNINRRKIPCLRCAGDVVWFNFFQLCQGPRSSADYIELAQRFHTVLISGVPVMGENEEDLAHRFIDLVDEFYDRKVKLILSAETKLINLYHGRRLLPQFRRTISRLKEMQSEEYLATPYRPQMEVKQQ